jgi:adenosylhomocysteinase
LFESFRGGSSFSEQYIPYIFKGRELEKKAVERDIAIIASGNISKCRLFLADYGNGKSTLGKYISYCAHDNGMLVSVLSKKDYKNFYKQDDFFISIIRNLKMTGIDEGRNPLEFIMNAWADDQLQQFREGIEPNSMEQIKDFLKRKDYIKSDIFIDFAASFLFCRLRGTDYSPLLGYLKGEKVDKRILKKVYSIRYFLDNNGLEFLRDFGFFIKGLGVSGLVIILDELETITKSRSDIISKMYDFLRELWDLLLEGEASGLYGVLLSTEEWLEDERKGVRSNPALHERLDIGDNKQNSQSSKIVMTNLNAQEYEKLFNELYHRYFETYSFDFEDHEALSTALWGYLKKRNTNFDHVVNVDARAFIKDVINALDSIADYFESKDERDLLSELEEILKLNDEEQFEKDDKDDFVGELF